jgi:hypothetical protein
LKHTEVSEQSLLHITVNLNEYWARALYWALAVSAKKKESERPNCLTERLFDTLEVGEQTLEVSNSLRLVVMSQKMVWEVQKWKME